MAKRQRQLILRLSIAILHETAADAKENNMFTYYNYVSASMFAYVTATAGGSLPLLAVRTSTAPTH